MSNQESSSKIRCFRVRKPEWMRRLCERGVASIGLECLSWDVGSEALSGVF